MKYNKSESEFEREAVPENQLKSWKSFLGMYSGEHTAGTEFMIGPLFLTVGVSAFDLLAGLFLGNLMAVLSWRFITADMAVKERFTLYFKLEKISINIVDVDGEKYTIHADVDSNLSLMDAIRDAGFPNMVLEKKVDFEKLYNQKFN